MPDQKRSKDITPQEDAIEIIEGMDDLIALQEFVEGDDRKGVGEAVAAKVKELTPEDDSEEPVSEKQEASDEADADSEKQEPSDEVEDGTADEDPAEDEEPEVAVVSVEVEKLVEVFEAVEARVEEERDNRTGPAKGVNGKLEEAYAALRKLVDTDADEVEIEEPALAGIMGKIAEKVAMDQERRGMMQPSANDRALKGALEEAHKSFK